MARATSRIPGGRPRDGTAWQLALRRRRDALLGSFLRECLAVTDDQIAVTCNLFADHLKRQQEIEQFWLDTLDLPQSCLRKSTVSVYSKYSQKKRKGALPHGTTRVAIHSVRVTQRIYGAIQEYGGFERPEWLG